MSETVIDALWYLGRGAGVLTLVLFSLTMVLGIVTRSGRPLPGLPRFAVTGLHRSVSLLAVTMLAVHVGTLLFDPYAQLRLVDVVLPFAGAYRPLWLGLGTLALDLTLAVLLTSALRTRIGVRGWRIVHGASYALWPVAVAHALGTGTDAGRWWVLGPLVLCVAAVLGALGWRLSARFTDPAARRPAAPAPLPMETIR